MVKLVVLDIDSCIIDSLTESEYKQMKYKIKKLPDCIWRIDGTNYYIFKRPYLDDFLKYCQKNFTYIALWTLGDKVWLDHVVKNIFPKNYPLLFKYTRQKAGPKYDNTGAYKKLSKVWDKYHYLGLGPHNTILVEDTIKNCDHNKGNCIEVKEYHVENHNDTTLPLLGRYLSNLKNSRRSIAGIDKRKWENDIIRDLRYRR